MKQEIFYGGFTALHEAFHEAQKENPNAFIWVSAVWDGSGYILHIETMEVTANDGN